MNLARAVAPAEVIALESADDPEGSSFWLALAEGPASVHTGPKKTENGRSLVPGGYYITVRYYERFPPSSSSALKLSDTKWTENAEGVIADGSCSACPRCVAALGPGLLIETHRYSSCSAKKTEHYPRQEPFPDRPAGSGIVEVADRRRPSPLNRDGHRPTPSVGDFSCRVNT